MAKKHSKRIPKYCLHKATGQAVVRLNGRDVYLGKHGTDQSRQEYDRLIALWLERGRVDDPKSLEDGVSIAELCLAAWTWADEYYRDREGQATRSLERIKKTIQLLRENYGDTLAKDFGPTKLVAFRQKLIDRELGRKYINYLINTTRLIFKRGVAMELIDQSIWRALTAVDNLKMGRTKAKESEPILPVDDETFEKTLPWLGPVVRDMVQVQRLCGCRPGEVLMMRPDDIERSGEIWLYIPERHKTRYRGKSRVIALGPKAQAILAKYLDRPDDAYLFSPQESQTLRYQEMRKQRKTKVQPSQHSRAKKSRKKPIRSNYTTNSYDHAIRYAFKKAERHGVIIKPWAANQLRHSAATQIRKEYGLEASQVVLGHSTADVTQIYAERDLQKAIEVAKELG